MMVLLTLVVIVLVPVSSASLVTKAVAVATAVPMAIDPRRISLGCCLAKSSPAAVDIRAAVPAANISAVVARPRFSLSGPHAVEAVLVPVEPAPWGRMLPLDFLRLLLDLALFEA